MAIVIKKFLIKLLNNKIKINFSLDGKNQKNWNNNQNYLIII